MIAQKIGMVGCGQMATALAKGFLRGGLVVGSQLCGADPLADARERFATATGATIAAGNASLADRVDVLFLAVKPQQIDAVLSELRGRLTGKLVISIAAGVKLSRLSEQLGPGVRLVRVMPNTPCLVGQGASAFCLGNSATSADAELVQQLLGAVGQAYSVDEKLMDAVTGLSGSGPAFVYIMIEALSDGGVRMGLPRQLATALAAQTVLGGAQMVVATGEHPAVLKDRVTSPGGTTIAGLKALEDGGLRAAVIAAVEAAARRAAELG